MTELPPRPKSRFGLEEWEWEERISKKNAIIEGVEKSEGAVAAEEKVLLTEG